MRSNHHAVIVAASLVATSLWLSPALASELTVTATSGQVTLVEHGRSVPPAVGLKLTLPVEIRTGSDGAVDVQQLGSTLHVGPSSTIALPETASPGNAVDKIKQSAGYVLYNIKSRKDHPLSVETPYLVSVVKGTVFTIAVEAHATTVALMEGSLDISAPGLAEHVLLKPNQSIRHADGESQLSVRSAASAAVAPRSELRAGAPMVLPEATQSAQMAQVAKDLADAGAAVTAGRVVSIRQAGQPSGPGNGGGNSAPGGGTSGATGSASGGSGSSGAASGGSSVGSTGSGSGGLSGSPGGSGSSGASNTGSSGGGGSPVSSGGSAGSGSSPGNSGSTGSNSSPGGSGSSGSGSSPGGSGSGSSGSSSGAGGSTSSPPVTLPPGSNSGTGNCNGKNNGTGNGNCYGHQSGKPKP